MGLLDRMLSGYVKRGELTLIKLRDRIEGRPARSAPVGPDVDDQGMPEVVDESSDETSDVAEAAWTGKRDADPSEMTDDALVTAKAQLAEAVETFMGILQAPNVVREISAIDRANLAKYLMIAKLRLENAIAVVRSESAIR